MLAVRQSRPRPIACPGASVYRTQRSGVAPAAKQHALALARSSCSRRSLVCWSAAGDSAVLADVQNRIKIAEAELQELNDLKVPANDPQRATLRELLLVLPKAENTLLEKAKDVVAARRPPSLSRINGQFARQLFAPFPPGAVPRELEAARLQQLLQTPIEATLCDPDDLLSQHKTLDELLTSCVTTGVGSNTGSAAALSLSQLEAGEVYQGLLRACEGPLRSEAASPGAWQSYWGQVVETIVSIAAQHAAAPITSDIAVTAQTLSMDANNRDVVVWLKGVPFLCGNAWPAGWNMQLPQLETWLRTTHHGASPAVYGHLGWVIYLLAAGSRVQLFSMRSDQDGYSAPLTGVLDMTKATERAALVLALVNTIRLACSINAESWLPRSAAAGSMIWVPQLRPSPYPVPDAAAATRNGWTPHHVTVTVGRQHIIKEYLAPGWALQDNLPLYERIMDKQVPNTVQVHRLLVGGEEYNPNRPFVPDSWYPVYVKMSPSAAQFTPSTPADLWRMVHAVLELLEQLHQLGFNHCDIRLHNMFWSGKWLLSDWELGGPANRPIRFNIKRLPDGFERGKTLYTNAIDLWQTAEMIREVLVEQRGLLKCPAAEKFAKLLQAPGMTAAIALQQLNRETW